MEEIKKVCVLSILDNTNRSKLSAYIMESQTCALNFFKKGVPMKMKVIFYIPFAIVELKIVRRHEVYRKKSSLRKKSMNKSKIPKDLGAKKFPCYCF